MNNDILVGRENELKIINDLINNKRNILVFGQKGVGKTSVILAVMGIIGQDKILYSSQSRTLKETLINLVFPAQAERARAKTMNVLTLKNKFYEVLTQNPRHVILDHLERVGPKYYSFLNCLIDKGIPIIVVSRGLTKEDIGHFRTLLFGFEKVEIRNLDKQTADELINCFIKEFGIKITKEGDFKKEIFSVSEGNPRIIKQLCFLARDVKYQSKGFVDIKLMDLDRRISEVVAE